MFWGKEARDLRPFVNGCNGLVNGQDRPDKIAARNIVQTFTFVQQKVLLTQPVGVNDKLLPGPRKTNLQFSAGRN